MADRARMKEGWLRTILELSGGIPSHGTFERGFRRLHPKELHACFLRCQGGDDLLALKGNHPR